MELGKPAPPLLTMGSPIPEGGCGCRMNGIPVMSAQCQLHGREMVVSGHFVAKPKAHVLPPVVILENIGGRVR